MSDEAVLSCFSMIGADPVRSGSEESQCSLRFHLGSVSLMSLLLARF